MNFKDLSLIEIIDQIKSWKTNSKEVFDYFQNRIAKYDAGNVDAYNFVNTNGLNTDTDSDSPLAGVALWVKDIFAEVGVPTTASSKMLENFIPAYDATTITKLKAAGMSSLGKLNMDEFAMGSTTGNSATKATLNPWGSNRVPGGSSGGSAAAVAAGLAPAALWTDTGWSLRQPASLCGVVGFRPSYGRNSRYGVFPMASSFDCPGTITKTVQDAGLLYDIMNGEDPKENTSLPGSHTLDPNIWKNKDLKWVRVGVPAEYFEDGIDPEVKAAIEAAIKDMENMGATIVPLSLPMTKYAIAAYYIIVPAEVSTNLGRLDGIRYGHKTQSNTQNLDEMYMANRGEWLGVEAQRRTAIGSYVLSAGFYDAYFTKAAKVRTKIIEEFSAAFEQVDVIACPASPSVATQVWDLESDALKMYLSDAYTIPSSLAGLPGICVPCGFATSQDEAAEKLPVWLHLIGPRLGEQDLLKVAHVYEQNTDWKDQMTPQGFED